ncbi:ABC transporter ATP-binding protein [Sedimentibacter sp. zth1]|uniref:ATP-binding cassette domain-containing protein n=1 Tax=Sedimentibacter sp. zth1 TaxID=2816908 RepID=UPI001A924341|nr:ABC transporter ATP-binding protein [Sedimentibacter sp. zth1]QSX05563.1 ABC transporter ATP-binding protein [Sedimentibacter sp. zth1]
MIKIIKVFRCCLQHFVMYKWQFIFSNLCILLRLAISIIQPIIYAKFVTSLYAMDKNGMILNLLYIIGFYLIGMFFMYIGSKVDIKIKKNVAIDIKRKLMKCTLTSRQTILNDYAMDKLMSIMYNDSLTARDYVYTICSYIKDVLNVIVVGFIIMKINFVLSVIVVLAFPLIIFINKKYAAKINKISKEIYKDTDNLVGIINKNVMNMNDIKYSNSIRTILKQFEEKTKIFNIKSIYCDNLKLNNSILSSLISFIGNMVFLFLGVYFITNDKIQVGMFIAYLSYSKIFTSSLFSITTMNANLQQQVVSAERVNCFLDKCKIGISKNELELIDVDNVENIKIDDVVLVKKGNTIFNKQSLNINSNNIVKLIGQNGCGKTSLLNLIANIYDANGGKIKFNDVNVNQIKFTSIVKNITYVSQIPIMYEMTIKQNLLMSKETENIDDKKLMEICSEFSILDDILNMPNQFETYITEDFNLSAGQKKKIQLIRCILRNTSVILFDEPLANTDNEFKIHFNDLINKYCKNKIVIVATHNSEYLNDYDTLVNINNKNIIVNYGGKNETNKIYG